MSAFKKQIGGSHYKDHKIQPYEFIQENNLSYLQGVVIKYIVRYDVKNAADPLEDLYKCKQCLEKLIFLMESDIEIEELTVEKIQKVITDQEKETINKYFTKSTE